jgi:hypothetical protein
MTPAGSQPQTRADQEAAFALPDQATGAAQWAALGVDEVGHVAAQGAKLPDQATAAGAPSAAAPMSAFRLGGHAQAAAIPATEHQASLPAPMVLDASSAATMAQGQVTDLAAAAASGRQDEPVAASEAGLLKQIQEIIAEAPDLGQTQVCEPRLGSAFALRL